MTLLFLICISLTWTTESLSFLLLPFFLIAGVFLLVYPSFAYYTLVVSLPFADEFNIANGLSIYLPSEPLMVYLLTFLTVQGIQFDKRVWGFLKNPAFLLLGFHLGWTFISIFYSTHWILSMKFWIAKWWFVAGFYLSTVYFIKDWRTVLGLLKALVIMSLLSVLYVNIQHAFYGFSFHSVNKVVRPFYRNHVDYAAFITLLYPIIWYGRNWFRPNGFAFYLMRVSLFIFPIAILLTYTRAAIGVLLLYPIIWLIFRYRLFYLALCVGALFMILSTFFLVKDYRFMTLAPNYETTIYHDEFGNLIEATYQLEDISSMERIYRWVAGKNMILDKPYLGYGANTFYENYKKYTVPAFKTYVSDNPEHSGIHNYILMIWVEQGLLGLLFWGVFILGLFILIYEYSKRSTGLEKQLSSVILLVFCGVIILNTINDLFENIKVGGIFLWVLGLAHLLIEDRFSNLKLKKSQYGQSELHF